jgi:hypothetical protein
VEGGDLDVSEAVFKLQVMGMQEEWYGDLVLSPPRGKVSAMHHCRRLGSPRE